MSGNLTKFRFPSRESYTIVSTKGQRVRHGLLILKILPAPDNSVRFCFVVKKKNGNAVFRNRCRRILRPVFFEAAKNFPSPVWIMVVVEMRSSEADWKKLRETALEISDQIRNGK